MLEEEVVTRPTIDSFMLTVVQERHPEFDIFQYGTEVLDGFDKKISGEFMHFYQNLISFAERNCVQPFAKVARTSQKFQVCRMFLATLQLVRLSYV